MSERIRIKWKTCWRCQGYGEVRSGIGVATAITTFGISSLLDADDMEDCPVCDGEGHLPVEVDVSDE